MRFLTRNLDACVTYKIIIPRCGDITLVKCENRFEIDSRNSGFPTFQSSILLPFFETSIRAKLSSISINFQSKFFFVLEKILGPIIDANLIRTSYAEANTNRFEIPSHHRLNSIGPRQSVANYELLCRKDTHVCNPFPEKLVRNSGSL